MWHSTLPALSVWPAALLLLVTPLAAAAQNTDDSEWNHLGVDFRVGFNIKAKFGNLGAVAAQPPPSVAGRVDHNYSDGFVRVDSSGDRGGVTWNWGYQNAAQVTGNDTLAMHATSSAGAALEAKDDPRLGFQINYARDLAHFGSGRWGLKLSVGYTDLKIRDTQPLLGPVTLTTDTYALGGITPPQAPYSGSFNGPGPVISDSPSRTVTTLAAAAAISGSRQLDIWLYDLRFGPCLELPLVKNLSFQIGGGVAAGLVDSTFSFEDTTTTSSGRRQTYGSGDKSEVLAGFYGEAGLGYQFVPHASLFAGGQFEYLGQFSQNVSGREAELNLRKSVYLVFGVQWHF